MNRKGTPDDAVVFLYIVPFIASAIYGLFLWVSAGVSSASGTTVYLGVTRDPYVFLVGSLAVILGVLLDLRSVDQGERMSKTKSVGDTLQIIAIASIVFSLIGAWAANGIGGLGKGINDFVLGRYSIVFPTMLILLSYLITIQLKIDSLFKPKTIGVLLLLLVPAVVYEIGKRDTAGGLAIGLVLLVVGMGIFLRSERENRASGE